VESAAEKDDLIVLNDDTLPTPQAMSSITFLPGTDLAGNGNSGESSTTTDLGFSTTSSVVITDAPPDVNLPQKLVKWLCNPEARSEKYIAANQLYQYAENYYARRYDRDGKMKGNAISWDESELGKARVSLAENMLDVIIYALSPYLSEKDDGRRWKRIVS